MPNKKETNKDISCFASGAACSSQLCAVTSAYLGNTQCYKSVSMIDSSIQIRFVHAQEIMLKYDDVMWERRFHFITPQLAQAQTKSHTLDTLAYTVKIRAAQLSEKKIAI